jgi:hypothetical protein
VEVKEQRLEDFFNKRPGMRKKYHLTGNLKTYVEETAGLAASQTSTGVMSEIILEKVRRIFSNETTFPGLEEQLSNHQVLSTADHHGLLNYNLLYNSNLLFAQVVKEMGLQFMVVPATGNIPLTNIVHPRGFFFKKQKFNFFTERKSKVPLFLFDQSLSTNREEGLKSFILNYSTDLISTEEEKFLEYLFFDCLEVERVSRFYDKFSDQLTVLNYKLWKYYFDKNLRNSMPDLLYLQANHIFVSTLIEEIKEDDSFVSHMLFEPDVRKVYLENFNGIQGAWDHNAGTEFFWGISEKKRIISLQIDQSSNSLVGKDIKIHIDRESIIDALNSNKIQPSLFFDYLVITFLEGYIALGGFNQLEYLPQMQQAHVKCLKEIGMNELADQFASRVTDGMICGMFPFDFDSGIDLIWHYNSTNGKFNGNMDGGLSQEDLDRMMNMKIRDMIESAVETMLGIVSGNR